MAPATHVKHEAALPGGALVVRDDPPALSPLEQRMMLAMAAHLGALDGLAAADPRLAEIVLRQLAPTAQPMSTIVADLSRGFLRDRPGA